MPGNYERIVEKIATKSGLLVNEIESRIQAKRSKLSGLISPEGAAQVVAAELGVSFEGEKLKIDELLPGMRNVNVFGKVINIFPVRSFKTKKGDESKVVNFWIADETSNIKVVLWDKNHVALVENGQIAKDTVVEIGNGTMRDTELHLGNFSQIKPSSELIENAITEKTFHEKKISDLKKGESASTRAFIVQSFAPKFFNVCPECGKKPTSEGESFSCATHGRIVPEKRALITLVLDDGTETIRAVLFSEAMKKLGMDSFDNPEKLSIQKETILGKEMMFSGNVRNNDFFNNLELVVDDAKDLDLDVVISGLENK